MRSKFLYLLAFLAVCSCTSHEATEQKEVAEQKDSVVQIEVAEPEDSVMLHENALDACEPVVVDENALKSEIAEQTLVLCQYIPDHGIREGAEEYMTAEYYRAYTEAIEAPRVNIDIGDDMYLYIFINDGEDDPVFSIENPEWDISIIDDTYAIVRVCIRDKYTNEPYMNSEKSVLRVEKINGRWLLSDFEDTKRECIEYVRSVRAMYKNGKAVNSLKSEGADKELMDMYYKQLEEFYNKYGK